MNKNHEQQAVENYVKHSQQLFKRAMGEFYDEVFVAMTTSFIGSPEQSAAILENVAINNEKRLQHVKSSLDSNGKILMRELEKSQKSEDDEKLSQIEDSLMAL
jgi:hypothetical protein